MPEEATDAMLVARALAGRDRGAFATLVRRHQGMVRAQLRRLTRGDHGWADDLAQETFLKAWQSLRQFRGDARLSTWLHRIAYRMFLQALRHRQPAAAMSEHELESPDPTPGPALRLDVMAAIDRLPDAERLCILHCYHLDLSHDEAAFVLEMPVGTVKTHIARGKSRLSESLAAWNPASEYTHE
jgi:RNA polymerase sigma factor (sigma-70 family)